MHLTKQQLAAAAFRAIADAIEQAPLVSSMDHPFSADDILASFWDGQTPFHVVLRDPSADDGLLDGCTICETEEHDADCPVGALESLYLAGLDTDKPFPGNLSVKGLTCEEDPEPDEAQVRAERQYRDLDRGEL
jgi:hypothetical protein